MDSISKVAEFGKVRVYPNGMHISPDKGRVVLGKKDGGFGAGPDTKRGEISWFSVAARRRMRNFLLSKEIKGACRFGITLTVPWKGDNFAGLMDEWRDCVSRFRHSFSYRFKNSGLVYRVELQKRGAPHIHAILSMVDGDYLPSGVSPTDDLRLAMLQTAISKIWVKSVHNLHHGSVSGFLAHGVLVEPIVDDGAMFRYLADHATKQKQAQLGYKGKQWGVIGEGKYTDIASDYLAFSNYLHRVIFLREIWKVCRYRLTDNKDTRKPCVFGSRKTPRRICVKCGKRKFRISTRRSVGDWYCSAATIARLFEWSRVQSLARLSIVPHGTFVKQPVDTAE